MNDQTDVKAAYRIAAEQCGLPVAPMVMPDQMVERRVSFRLPRWLSVRWPAWS